MCSAATLLLNPAKRSQEKSSLHWARELPGRRLSRNGSRVSEDEPMQGPTLKASGLWWEDEE